MAYNFPNSPSNGDTVTVNNVTYTYNSTLGVWSTAVAAPTEPAISSDGATPSLTSGITAIEVKNLLGIPTDISNVIDGAPSTLNTLDKLAAAINDDANFHTNVAPLVSPAFTGAPTAPTATTGTNTTQLATTEFVQTEISGFTTLTGLSVTSNTAAGGGTLTYNNTTGVFTYTPPSLAFSNISSTPTTIAGYGITDAFDGAFSSLTGVPTTISGYGITDAFDGVFASLTAKPSTIAGYGITDAFDGAFSSLTGVPTTISGYGITDAFDGAFSSLTSVPTTISGYGITDAFDGAFSSLTGVPTTVSGYGITDTYTTGAHLIPTANETYDLGSSSNKFRDLYLSGTSIHLGSQEITSDTGGVVVSGLKIGSGANQVTLSASNGELQSGSNSYLIAGSDLDLGSNDITTTGRIYFANMFSQTSDLPSASTYHGMFAHVHSAGAAYFAHGGNWIELANKSYVDTEVAALVNSAPATLDTLDELAAALNDDANFATTVTTSLSQKAPLQNPALTGTPTAPTAGAGTNNTQIATTAYVDTAVAGASGTYSDASVDTHLNTGTAATNEVLSWNGSDYDWVAQSGGGGGASVTTSDAAPSSPSAGDLWYNTNAGGLFVYYTDANSSQWVEVVGKTGATGATGASGVNVNISDAAPTSPSTGQFWWNSSTNKLYIYYTDANSSQWVQATTPGADGADGADGGISRYANVAAFPASPTAADLAYANDTNTLYLYNGTAWEVVASGNDESPVITTEPPTTTQELNSDGTTSTVTMVAQDPEGFGITYGIAYKTANNARPAQLSADTTINQSTGVYTFTPTTTESNAGTFRARLSASDGARITTRFVDFNLTFIVADITNWQYHSTVPLQKITDSKVLTVSNGGSWQSYVSNLSTLAPYLEGAWGTTDVNTSNTASITFDGPVRIWLLRDDSSWGAVGDINTYTSHATLSSTAITGANVVNVYRKDVSAGTYSIDNHSAMYFITAQDGSKDKIQYYGADLP